MTRIWYTTRGAFKASFDSRETARNNKQVDAAISAGSDLVDGLLRRTFYPELDTRYFDWPTNPSWRLYLNQNELITATSVLVGEDATAVLAADYFLEPQGNGPPYDVLELNTGRNGSLVDGATRQNAVVITGLFGYRNDEETCGLLAEALDSSETGVDITDSSTVGVGSVIRIESERMQVTRQSMLDTTQDTTGVLTDDNADTLVGVADGTAFFENEVILIGAEKMLIVEIAGNNLIVERAYDGTVLADHSLGVSVYAPRSLTVVRGVLGTTAAAHNTATAISRWLPPPLVEELCIAEAANVYQSRTGGWAGSVQRGENRVAMGGTQLEDLRKRAIQAHGRKLAARSV